MKNYLFIDDIRMTQKIEGYKIYIARTYDEAIAILTRKRFNIISFDHDLGESKSGYDIAKYIIENQIEIKEGFKIHSANPVGRFNIMQLLTHYGYKYLD